MSLRLNNLVGFGVSSRSSAVIKSLTLVDTDEVDGSGDYTVNLGAVAAGDDVRTIIVVAADVSSIADVLTACTINGVSATIVTGANSGKNTVTIAYAQVDSGTTGVTISPTWGDLVYNTAMAVYSCIASSAAVPSTGEKVTSTTDPVSDSLNVSSPGFIIAGNQSNNGAGTTWTGLTEDCDFDHASADFFTTASAVYASGGSKAYTSTEDGAFDQMAHMAVAFELSA